MSQPLVVQQVQNNDFQKYDNSIELPELTNILSTENYAILEAIELVNSLQTTNILIISDSLSVPIDQKTRSPKMKLHK